ncbi:MULTISPECIES: DNA polymerase III subunit gamma/tau [unclassified Gemella]|uniref:DNA polymerase III subunit gamma/tau n=1 Tax=unclassified Gemella TaxID=2624949 RepID=UPI0010745E86|nr:MULTISPECIES: DNA polymerase III subunit gamma/tau [unclassified Gemella]MBF0710629.1 DNA polymerase III subunit gamma/tau [Gemella sp. GL1.1]MBF0746392.1 DNA polymerase III subunit gamma/tau [Gemella sp. 19428wG2_WT2a]NYS27973.1 DNA polymerase III subunit gamma/tau [Gemella sp. GL1]TFU60175.1 DNA polymerase III subunit gamma/tau [Gemella sp. WT2a]
MFKALYRKYRPKNFDDVVGQNHVISVLKNAIKMDKIAHAYIFYGPRGTGKTSIAKIFANEVNKNENYQSDSVDIIEIDAASNNGVDEIRDIKEAIKFAPTEGKYKIYIIDEVHMLTISAFNALLKTLEEPPSHIIFILATTEMHKIPATILSRCQKFEFKNISNAELVERLKYVAEKEEIDIDDQALKKIALIAKGGLRDAIGILDQVSNYNMGKVKLEDVLDISSAVGDEEIISLYKLILEGNSSGALVKYTEFIEKAKDTKLLLNDLINLSRDMIIYKNTRVVEFCEYDLEGLREIIEKIPSEKLYKNIEYLAEAEVNIRFSTEYVSYMQICLIKMADSWMGKEVERSLVDKLEERITMLEERIRNFSTNKINEPMPTQLKVDIEKEEKMDSTLQNNIKKIERKEILSSSASLEVQTKVKNIELEKIIIPNKEKIKEVISQSSDKFTSYAANVFSRIMQESISSHSEIYELFQDANLKYSSKKAAVLIFKNPQDLFRLESNDSYKEFIEIRFQKLLGVSYKYRVFALQEEQYQALQKLITSENVSLEKKLDNEKKREDKKVSKIEALFQDIIVEE